MWMNAWMYLIVSRGGRFDLLTQTPDADAPLVDAMRILFCFAKITRDELQAEEDRWHAEYSAALEDANREHDERSP